MDDYVINVTIFLHLLIGSRDEASMVNNENKSNITL